MIELPIHTIYEVLIRLDLNSICQMRLVADEFDALINDYFWKQKCQGEGIIQNFHNRAYSWLYSAYNRRMQYEVPLFRGPWDKRCQFQKQYYGEPLVAAHTAKIPKEEVHPSCLINGEGRIDYIYNELTDLLIREHVTADLLSLGDWDVEHNDHTLVKLDNTGHYSYQKHGSTIYFIRYVPFGAILLGFCGPVRVNDIGDRYVHITYPTYYVGDTQCGMRSGAGIIRFECGFEIAYDGWTDPITYNVNISHRSEGDAPITPSHSINVIKSMLTKWVTYCQKGLTKKILDGVPTMLVSE